MFVNPKTGLVALKYLGTVDPALADADGNPVKVGHAGAGLRVGEVRGFEPAAAKWLIDNGMAEEVPEKEVRKAMGLDDAVASANADAIATGKAAAADATAKIKDAKA